MHTQEANFAYKFEQDSSGLDFGVKVTLQGYAYGGRFKRFAARVGEGLVNAIATDTDTDTDTNVGKSGSDASGQNANADAKAKV